jgi:hypothetical protein
VFVGSCVTSPAPQIHCPGTAGDRNAVNWMSPRQFSRSPIGLSAGIEITGTMVRVMMFQSLLTDTGITGWMFRMFCVPPCGPTLKLVLF